MEVKPTVLKPRPQSESGLANDILEQRANFTVLFQKEIEVRHGYR